MKNCFYRRPKLSSPSAVPRRRQAARAFTLIELLFALMIFVLMSLMVAAVIPVSAGTQQFSSSYNQAMSISQHKIDQLQKMTRTKGLSETFKVTTLEAVDPATSKPLVDDATLNGDGTISATFTNADNLNRYFSGAKSGADANDPNGLSGQIILKPYYYGTPSVMTLCSAKITIKWREAGKAQSNYTIEALLTSASNTSN